MIKFRIALNALRAVEAVARLGALEPAAAELGVTMGAVSQQLRRAEARLGVELFERSASGLKPTPGLVAQLPALRRGFDTLAAAATALAGQDDGVLTLTVGNVFASRWLVKRLGRFTAAHPDLEFRLVATGKIIDLNRGDIDCGIRYGRGDWPGVRAQLLGGPSVVLPVAAPTLAAQLGQPADVAKVPVILDEATMLSWPAWLEAAGVAPAPELNGPVYSDPALAFDAAVAGQGVLLAVEMMAADALADRRLVAPFATRLETGLGYWFVTSAERQMPPKVRRFLSWLESELQSASPIAASAAIA